MNERVRILYLTISGELNGGAVIQYRYLVEGLRGSRYEPIVVSRTAGDLNDVLARTGIQSAVLPCPIWSRGEGLRWGHRLWIERRRARARLIAFARAHSPHLVHGDFMVAPYVTAVAAALGIGAVIHVRGSLTQRWVRRLGLARADALIAIGHPYRDELVGCQIPGPRIVVVPDATDLNRFRAGGDILRREDPSIAANEILFGIVGPITAFKRQLEFVRAAERVIASGRLARFFLIGAPNMNRPWYVHRVHAFIRERRIGRWFTFAGHRGDMERVMPSLDVLVTLSGGSVMLEAMACGVPVITASARDPDSLRIVRDGESGRVVPADDPDALTRVMAELCDDAGQRCRLSANGRRRAEALFGRDHLVDDTVRLYDTLLDARPHSRSLGAMSSCSSLDARAQAADRIECDRSVLRGARVPVALDGSHPARCRPRKE